LFIHVTTNVNIGYLHQSVIEVSSNDLHGHNKDNNLWVLQSKLTFISNGKWISVVLIISYRMETVSHVHTFSMRTVPITNFISTLICAPFMSLSMREYYHISGSYSYSVSLLKFQRFRHRIICSWMIHVRLFVYPSFITPLLNSDLLSLYLISRLHKCYKFSMFIKHVATLSNVQCSSSNTSTQLIDLFCICCWP